MNTLIIGKTPAGVPVPVQVDANGVLQSNLSASGSFTISNVTIDQTGPTTNGVSVKSSVLPTDAATQTTLAAVNSKLTDVATATLQTAGNSTLSTINGKIAACNTGSVTIISSTLPAGAATEAKQPSLGTAGSPSANVITVQGIASGTVIPVSGTVTANNPTVSISSSSAAEAGRVAKSSSGTIYNVSGHNNGTSGFVQVYNSTTVPTDGAGAVPIVTFAVASGTSFSIDFPRGIPLSTGITVSNSNNFANKQGSHANFFYTVSYV